MTGAGRVDLLLGNGYDPDVRARRVASALAAAGWDVRILAWDRDGTRPRRDEDGAIAVERVRLRSRWGRGVTQGLFLAALAVHYLRRVRKRRPDVIHAVDMPMLVIALLIAPFVGRPRIVYDAFEIYAVMVSHRMPRPALWLIEQLERRLPRRADLVIVPGEARQAYFADHGVRTISVPNWIDPPVRVTPRAEARRRYDIPGGRFAVVYAGAILASRDLDALLRHAHRRPEDLVLIAGRGDDEGRLRLAAEALDNVRVLGWVADPEALFAAADAVYYSLRPDHPYAALAAPNNLYSAIAHAVPLIYRPQGELGVVGRQERIGVAFEDDAGLDVAIGHLRDQEFNAAVRESLRSLRDRFSWSRAAETLVAAYPKKGSAASKLSA